MTVVPLESNNMTLEKAEELVDKIKGLDRQEAIKVILEWAN